ncbi:MAG: hypothetical protein MZV65_38940 [Chromatiales bacterium]|nr:hypothetical protein [Chromatiales bacterium]
MSDVEFSLKRGDAWQHPFTWRQGSATGEPANLTGVTASLHLKRADRTSELVLDCSPYLTVDGPAGTVLVDVPKAATRLFPVGKLKFDIELSNDIPSTETMYLNVVEDVTVPI